MWLGGGTSEWFILKNRPPFTITRTDLLTTKECHSTPPRQASSCRREPGLLLVKSAEVRRLSLASSISFLQKSLLNALVPSGSSFMCINTACHQSRSPFASMGCNGRYTGGQTLWWRQGGPSLRKQAIPSEPYPTLHHPPAGRMGGPEQLQAVTPHPEHMWHHWLLRGSGGRTTSCLETQCAFTATSGVADGMPEGNGSWHV